MMTHGGVARHGGRRIYVLSLSLEASAKVVETEQGNEVISFCQGQGGFRIMVKEVRIPQKIY
jgi:hypothetical protein